MHTMFRVLGATIGSFSPFPFFYLSVGVFFRRFQLVYNEIYLFPIYEFMRTYALHFILFLLSFHVLSFFSRPCLWRWRQRWQWQWYNRSEDQNGQCHIRNDISISTKRKNIMEYLVPFEFTEGTNA